MNFQIEIPELTKDISYFIDSYSNKFIKNKLVSADLNSVVGELTDYNLITTDIYCGGYHDSVNKQIALSDLNKDSYEILFHEMAHVIQFELEVYEILPKLISEELKFERQAELIAYNLYRKCFPEKYINMNSFNAYTNECDWKFLIDWYGDSRQNDIEHYFK